MDTKPLVTVYIPIYNAEKYLMQCLKSIVEQTYKNLEIICVDDQSSDSSSNIVKDYMKTDKRIKLITRKGTKGGEAVVRNLAVANANGKYVASCDADDYMLPSMIDKMVSSIEKESSDIIYCERYSFIDGKNDLKHEKFRKWLRCSLSPLSRDDVEPKIFDIPPEAWIKLVKTDIAKKIKFPEYILIGTDSCQSIELLLNSKRISFISEPLYCYRIRKDSLSHASGKIKVHQAYMFEYIFDILYKYNKLSSCIHPFLKLLYSSAINNYFQLAPSDRELYRNIIRIFLSKHKRVFNYRSTCLKLKLWIFYVLYKIIPGGRSKLRNFFKFYYKQNLFVKIFW